MSGDRAAQLALYAVMLILPCAALTARRPSLGPLLRMTAAWIAIFAVGILLASQRDRLPSLAGMFGRQQVSGSETRIPIGEDGHYWADVTIDGVNRRMLIDSGATTTALSATTAKAVKLNLEESPFPIIISTANGNISARTATAKTVTIGSVTMRDLGIVTSPAFGDTDVIGMNFLSKLNGWRVEQNTLVLTPGS